MPKIKENENIQEEEIEVKTVDASELKQDDLILDIRSHFQHALRTLKRPHWYMEGRDVNPIEFIRNFGLDGQKTLYILCTSGRKSIEKAREFIKAGFKNVASINGGIKAAQRAGFQTTENYQASIQKQVPLTAGTGILIGLIGGWFITSWFYLLALFIGIGLITWGITGECTIEKILTYMPWNKSKEI